MTSSGGSVGVRPGEYSGDNDLVLLFVDSIQDPVCPSASAVAVGQGRTQALTDTMRTLQQRPDDELEGSERNRFR